MNWMEYISFMRLELVLLAVLVILLIWKVGSDEALNPIVIQLINFSLLGVAILAFCCPVEGTLFGGMFVATKMAAMQKGILAFAAFLICLSANEWLKKHSNYLEFYMMLIAVLAGMFYMISSGHFLMFYLGLELATIPLAALAAFDFEKQRSSESGVKMILSSAFSSAILLFGISFIYGSCGSLYFSDVAQRAGSEPIDLIAFGFIIAGFAFKISAVPFHLWTADVYEGAPVPVTAFLSVVSKGAAIFVFTSTLYSVFAGMQGSWTLIISVIAVVTMTLGNLMAMRQKSIKRFLAFSSITQVGYLLIAVAAASAQSYTSLIYFILIYVFSNLGAFAVVSVISDRTGKENIGDYASLYKSNPSLAIIMTLAVFSLAGIPPTAGFFGKLFLLASGASEGMVWVIIIACLNMVISLYYYLRIVKAMFVDKREDPLAQIKLSHSELITLVICVAGILATGFFSQVFDHISTVTFGVQ